MKWEMCRFLLGMGLRTSGMRISTRAWYMRWSQVLIHLSTASFLHSANSCELGSRASISLMLLSKRINTDLEIKSHAFARELVTLHSCIILSSPVFRYGGALYSISGGITPKRLPQLLNQTELKVDDHVQDSLRGKK